MRYRSTRAAPSTPSVSFRDAVLTGLAPDGGLYVPVLPADPAAQPTLPPLATLHSLDFADLAVVVMRPYISPEEIPDVDLQQLCRAAWKRFDDSAVVAPLVRCPALDGDGGDEAYVLELFHGPTLAFKDVALQFLGHLFAYFLEHDDRAPAAAPPRQMTVLGATSGDTGSAAIHALMRHEAIHTIILYPGPERVSPIQELQMTTVDAPNVHCVRMDGARFDDCQGVVKSLFGEDAFREKWRLGAVNSINWARVLAQTVYHVWAAVKLSQIAQSSSAVRRRRIVVPTGNFGNVLAAHYARRAGACWDELVTATNANDVVHRVLETGCYAKQDVVETCSPAMDISVSSNFERMVFEAVFETSGRNADIAGKAVQERWQLLKDKGGFNLSASELQWMREACGLRSTSATDADVAVEMKACWTRGKYVLDPHTAVGVAATRKLPGATSTGPMQTVYCATAHPSKFPAALDAALGSEPGFSAASIEPASVRALRTKKQRIVVVERREGEAWADVIRVLIPKLGAAQKEQVPAVNA